MPAATSISLAGFTTRRMWLGYRCVRGSNSASVSSDTRQRPSAPAASWTAIRR
jgi:hypothetical protein